MKELKLRLMERMLGGELTAHLGYEAGAAPPSGQDNRRNGGTTTRVKGQDGEMPLTVPRDRDGSFEPELVKKGQTRIDGIDDKIIGLYAHGLTVRDIQAHLEDLYVKGSFVDDLRNRSLRERAFGHLVAPQGLSVQFPDSQTFGGDNVYSSVQDLAQWDRNFDKPIVGGAAVIARMMSRPRLPNGETIPYAYGLGLGTYRGLRNRFHSISRRQVERTYRVDSAGRGLGS